MAKMNRYGGEIEKGLKNINTALSLFDYQDISLKKADALDEYAVLQRKSHNDPHNIIQELQRSREIRMKLVDEESIGLTYLYLGNTYFAYDTLKHSLDSALFYFELAYHHLAKTDEYLAMHSLHNLGKYHLIKGNTDEALSAYKESGNYFLFNGYDSYYVNCKLGEIDVHLTKANTSKAIEILDQLILDSIFTSNLEYRNNLFLSFQDYYRLTEDFERAFVMQDSLNEITHRQFKKKDFKAKELYESERHKQKAIESELEAIRLFTLTIGLASFLILFFTGFIFYHKWQKEKRKLREKEHLLEQKEALQKERDRIAAEMHDDLGGGLTTIQYVGQRALRKIKEPNDRLLIEKMIDHSNVLISNMSEIIWAMKSKFDKLDSTIFYMRRVAKEYLQEHGVSIVFETDIQNSELPLTSLVRRNLLLVLKEALHNIVKHSKASESVVSISQYQNTLTMIIRDNGVGIGSGNMLGNGLSNMTNRMESIGGSLAIENLQHGTLLACKLPV